MNKLKHVWCYINRFLYPVRILPRYYMRYLLVSMFRALYPIIWLICLRYLVVQLEQWSVDWFTRSLIVFGIILCIYHGLSYVVRHRWWAQTTHRTFQVLYAKYIPLFVTLNNTYTEQIGTGKLIAILEKWTYCWRELLSGLSVHIPRLLCTAVMLIYISVKTLWVFWLMCMVILAVMFVVIAWLDTKAIAHRNIRIQREHEETRQVVKIIQSKFEILSHHKIDTEIMQLHEIGDKIWEQAIKVNNIVYTMFNIPHRIATCAKIWCLWYMGYGYLWWQYLISDIVTMWVAIQLMDGVILTITEFYKNFTKSIATVTKLRSNFDDIPPMLWYDQWDMFQYHQGTIKLENVSFSYGSNQVLHRLHMTISWGSKTALVGLSGAGKSTLMKLIAGYLHPSDGCISIDGQYLPWSVWVDHTVSLQSYFPHIWYLSQEPNVFDGTVYQNLLYWLESNNIDKERVRQIIASACCDFIYDLPDGLDTQIWERGIKLSGGQKQRLAIAKIMLKNPRIILLDEPTSALDSIYEQEVTHALHSLLSGRTVVVIAHRLQTVQTADYIFVFDQGVVVQQGTHQDLITQWWVYKQMLELQSTTLVW